MVRIKDYSGVRFSQKSKIDLTIISRLKNWFSQMHSVKSD